MVVISRCILAAVVLLVTACGQPTPANRAPAAAGQPGAQTGGPSGTLRIAWPTEPETLASKLAGGGSAVNEFNWIFNSYLTYYDFNGRLHPLIAREIPTQENGGWVMNPDGTMTTTYHLRDNARWHDGTPITAHDFVFAYTIYLDPDVPVRDRHPENLMAGVEARDDRTLVVSWREPYVNANALGYQQLDPLPRHVFEAKYQSNRTNFSLGEEWNSAYVGSGPFKIERWNPGIGLVARAHGDWLLGAPRIATLEIRFIPDPNALIANLLSGEVDLLSSGIRPSDVAAIQGQWAEQGYVKSWAFRLRYMAFQHREVPNWQPAVNDVRVRRALMHAVDREGLVETITHGLGRTGDAFILPQEEAFPDVDRAIAKYPYDPNRAAALIAEAGWRAPQAGALATNAAGQPLDIEIWTTSGGAGETEASIMAQNFRAAGMNASFYLIPSARQRDNEHRTSYPALETTARAVSPDNFVFTSRHHPKPEARWNGPNRGSFVDPTVDRLYEAMLSTFDPAERRRTTVALHQRMADIVGIGPLYYDVEVLLAKHRLKGPIGNYGGQQGATWNAHEWELGS